MAKTPRVRDIGVDPDLLKAEARVAELEKLLLESERRDVAGDAKVKRLEAEVEKLREMLARVKSKTALDVVAENMEAQAAKRKAEAERDRLRRQRNDAWNAVIRLKGSASYTDEDVERVAEAIYSALADSYSIARETTEAPTKAELLDAARAALDAFLKAPQ